MATSPSRLCQFGPDQLEDRRPAPGRRSVEQPAQRLAAHHLELDLEPGEPVAQHRVVDRAVVPGQRRPRRRARGRSRPPGPSTETPRSKPSSAIATRQPSPGSPTTRSASVRAPVKKTSLNSEPPVSCSIGRTSTPSWSSGTSRKDSPWWRSEPGSVRRDARTAHWLKWALDVHTFWPSMTHSSPSTARLGLHVGQVGAGAGLGVALRPELLDGQDLGQEPVLLLLGAERHQRRPEQLLAEVVDPHRRVGPGVLLVEDHLLRPGSARGRRAPSASRRRSSRARRAAGSRRAARRAPRGRARRRRGR